MGGPARSLEPCVVMLPTGSGANVLCLSAFLQPVHSVVIAAEAHASVSTAGGLAHGVGGKVLHVPSDPRTGKVGAGDVGRAVEEEKAGGTFATVPRVLSVSLSLIHI